MAVEISRVYAKFPEDSMIYSVDSCLFLATFDLWYR